MLKLSRASIQWAIGQASNYGDTDVFPPVFEFEAIEHQSDEIIRWLTDDNILDWNVRPPRRCITPKHRYGFRISTQLDPIDFLIYTALVYEIGEELEIRRVPIGDNIVHSYRFQPEGDGRMFKPDTNYETFRQKCKDMAEDCEWVTIADIADFFPRLYLHRVKNALDSATSKNNHVRALEHMLSSWNEHYSYGIPVGCMASRLIAEVAIDDVDRSLLSRGTKYTRFSDDFRIFCQTKREAYAELAFLANVLFENHGLTLQQHKTRIITKEQYKTSYLSSEREQEMSTLSNAFKKLAAELELDTVYDQINWDDLTPAQRSMLSELNLTDILNEQANADEIDIPLTRFVLNRLGQIGRKDTLQSVLTNIDKLYPIIPAVVGYIKNLRDLDEQTKVDIGSTLLDCVDSSLISHLEFHRMWIMHLFAKDIEYDNKDRFAEISAKWSDQFTQREVILALGRSKQDEWFRLQKRNISNFTPWVKRAILVGGSCFPHDERNHWYQSLEPRLDKLEIAVTKWARHNPYGA